MVVGHADLHELFEAIRQRFGADSVVLVTHWEADLRAIAIAKSSDPRILAYVTSPLGAHRAFDLELEGHGTSLESGEELPYTVVGRFDAVPAEVAISLIARHLELEPPENQLAPRTDSS